MRADRPTRVWTIQPRSVWEALQSRGEVKVDPTCFRDCFFPGRYLWLVEQLRLRRGYGAGLPWWSYVSKPDLRYHRHSRLKGGSRQVRLEIEIASSNLTCFPIWAWGTVYCGGFLALSEPERADWKLRLEGARLDEDLWPYPEPWRGELEASWERLFSPDLPDLCPWREEGFDHNHNCDREAVFEVLKLSEVRRVTEFNCRPRRRT